MHHPVIVVDIDGVLFNTPADAVAAFNSEQGTDHRVEDIFNYDARPDKTKFYIDGVDHFHKHQHDTAAYHEVPGAKEALRRLHAKGAQIVALTSRHYGKFYDGTLAALDKHFGVGAGPDDLISTVHFTSQAGSDDKREKGEIIKELGGQILVDDAVRFCESAARHGVYAILLSQPYNQQGHEWPPEQRAEDWAAAERLIEERLRAV
jgi:phosphoglycolate phosphatase-like HAD superfamily hydrolase